MKSKYFFLVLILLPLLSQQTIAQPVITSFSPTSGPVGTTVTINGSGFSAAISSNIVYFGAMRANITAASSGSLSVVVPVGATYKPITVTTGGLTAYAARPFNITFSSGPMTWSTFTARSDFSSGNYPRNASIGDIDGDGKADVASVNNNGNDVSIFRNTSVPGTVSFAAPLFIATGTTPMGEKLVDVDGDGKLDLVVNNYASQTFSVFRNTSTPGNISFATAVVLAANQNPAWIDLGDFDGDGKPELISFNQNADSYSIFKNTSTPGSISFAVRVDASLGARPNGGTIGDVDGDGKLDFVATEMDNNKISVYRNTSSGATISFAPKVTYNTGVQPWMITISDIDGDNKSELLVANSQSSDFSLFANNCTPGNIAFSFIGNANAGGGTSPLYVSVDDLDGDGKIDVTTANFGTSNVTVFKNLSTPGNFAFAVTIQYPTGSFCRSCPIGDIDGDGRPDIVTSNSLSNNISVLRNLTTPVTCPGAVSSFPYRETFESSDGNWTTGGAASDWAWGAPAKPVITAAGEGSKCWITGGLTTSLYNNNERSNLQSPCFDFSSLIHPRISFNIFWETEPTYDGASLQYSTDGGTSWSTVGSINSNSNCQGINWYNTANVTTLSAAGWTGSKQSTGNCANGNGSNVWLTAAHDLSFLAGQSQVSFKFVFGAGTICNGYDGFAIDDVNIFESPPSTADFSYTCKPNKAVDFTSLSVCSAAAAWDFGDPASGASNLSAVTNPTHIFSAPGIYTVRLTSTFITGNTSVTKQVNILDVMAVITKPISCASAQDAILTAAASGSVNPYSYTWNTVPPQTTPVINNIGPGTYSVLVTSGTACPVTTSLIVTEPATLKVNPVITAQICAAPNGSVVSNVSGGSSPYIYTWNTSATTANITGLMAGTYSLQLTDNHGCILNMGNIVVPNVQQNIPVSLGRDTFICPGQHLILDPGSYSSYLWQDNSTNRIFMVTQTGTYAVTVTDNNGCIGRASINVTVDCSDIYFPLGFTPNRDGRNDLFGPAGNNFSAIKDYSLIIYNRYGEKVFYSTDPYYKWDGRFKGQWPDTGVYAWYATYSVNGKAMVKKGTVVAIR